MSHIAYLSAAAEYDAREPAEAPQVVTLGGGATLRHLATVLDEHGVEVLHVRARAGRYTVRADTRWQSEECESADLATAIQDAICTVVEARRLDQAAAAAAMEGR